MIIAHLKILNNINEIYLFEMCKNCVNLIYLSILLDIKINLY